ncbi:PDZ domain-containing protein, partial [Clostridioides difficile]
AVGLQVGDKINKINGNSVKTWDEVANIINTSSGGELKLSITRNVSICFVISTVVLHAFTIDPKKSFSLCG